MIMKYTATVSDDFKKNTVWAILSVFLFIIVYVILLSFSILLTLFCGYFGIMIMVSHFHYTTLAIGISLIGLGILILVFLIKFIFKENATDKSNFIEITRQEEPQLFSLIDTIVEEVGTDFPKRVYLSEDVNAAVFYDSTFWSMFLPVKKNLQIGLGLINIVSQMELKAILAHEFGHFSQKSMKVGSYVHNVNQIIYNMLYENTSYSSFIQGFASINNLTALASYIAVGFIKVIQWILQKMYSIINIRYLKLSREMEFHADEVAAHVTGYMPLKTSLLRLDLAEHSYSSVIKFYSGKVSDCIRSKNVFKEQHSVMKFLASEINLEIKESYPLVTFEHINKYNKSKLNFTSQWTSHPSLKDRISALEKTNIVKENDDFKPANQLFSNIEILQETVTDQIFSKVQYKDSVTQYSLGDFTKAYTSDFYTNSYNKFYNNYYDSRNPIKFKEEYKQISFDGNISDLFSTEKIENIYISQALNNDIESLKHIGDKRNKIKSFDYDGIKYTRKNVKELIEKLSIELEECNLLNEENDKQIFAAFNNLALKTGKEKQFTEKHILFTNTEDFFNIKNDFLNDFIEKTNFFQYETSTAKIKEHVSKLYKLEEEFKKNINGILNNSHYASKLSDDTKTSFEKYISDKQIYFVEKEDIYNNDTILLLFICIQEFSDFLAQLMFDTKKDFLEFQAELMN